MAGQDAKAHDAKPRKLEGPGSGALGGKEIWNRFESFKSQLPAMAERAGRVPRLFDDSSDFVRALLSASNIFERGTSNKATRVNRE